MFYSKYKRKNPSYVLEVFDVLCVESLVRTKDVYLHTHTHTHTLNVIKIKIYFKNLVIASVDA